MADGHHEIARSKVTAAETLSRRKAALDRYPSLLRNRGAAIDLRLLGAALAPIPLDLADAEIEATVPSGDDRHSRDLVWAFLRRGRMVLTGLPGGGKSLALSIAAARLLDIADAPLPVAVSLRDIDRGHRTHGFRDRLLDSAVKDLPNDDRLTVRAELERRLTEGSLALLLDSLDETHGRRAQVVAEIDEFTKTISDDVDILLATRDVAYGFAETLGWPALRLAKPKDITRTVKAVLNASAAISTPAKDKDWIGVRERWVTSALAKDSTLSETPLLPILLSLLAITKQSEALPTTRATILHEMVKAIVTRQETRQGNEFRVGALDGRSAAGALLDGFTLEAITIAVDGGQSIFGRLIGEVSHGLTPRWGLHAGQADVTGEAVVRFWDETGIFVMSGADEVVAPRVELFAEIGEALHIAHKPEQEISRWADQAIEAGRLESVILAAGLSTAASRLLLQAATTHKRYELLHASMTAVRQGAEPVEPEFTNFINVLAEESRFGDREAWRIWAAATKLPLSTSLMDRLLESLGFFPAEYQLAARTALLLRGHPEAAMGDRHAQLLGTLRLKALSPLSRRHNGPNKYSLATVDSLYSEAVEGAAAELLGQHEEAAALVAEALNHGSMGMQERLCELLRQRGFSQLADEFSERRWSKFRESLAGLGNFDLDAHRQLLRDLADRPKAALNYQAATRLNELADFCETMNLNDISAWPRVRSKYGEWFWPLAQLVEALGRFDSPTIAAQAALTLQRLETAGDADRAFFYIFDQSHVRALVAWEHLVEADDAVRLLVGTFFRGRGAAIVAARALWEAPVAELAVPELIHALPQLQPRPELQRIAALTLLSLTRNREIGDWATDPNPVLRKIAAERSPVHNGQAITSTISQMLNDIDGHVVAAALRRLDPMTVAAKAEFERLSTQENPGWLCLHCSTNNAKGGRSCSQCHVFGPEPAALAAALLNGTARPATVVLDLDDFGDFDD